jgi:hypothetical protein
MGLALFPTLPRPGQYARKGMVYIQVDQAGRIISDRESPGKQQQLYASTMYGAGRLVMTES